MYPPLSAFKFYEVPFLVSRIRANSKPTYKRIDDISESQTNCSTEDSYERKEREKLCSKEHQKNSHEENIKYPSMY